MLDCEMWDSWPKTKAEWQKPDSCRYRYTKKLTSSVEKDIVKGSGGSALSEMRKNTSLRENKYMPLHTKYTELLAPYIRQNKLYDF